MGKSTDALFRLGLIFKGADSVLEVIGGCLLIQPTRMARYLSVLSQHEVYRHHEVLSGRIDHLAQTITVHSSIWEAAYLLVHGLAKVVLILAIFRNQKWGYVGLIGVLSFFTLIEMTRAVTAHELVTGALGLFDLGIVVLIYKEYKSRFVDQASPAELSKAS